jgi:hypothetical protein
VEQYKSDRTFVLSGLLMNEIFNDLMSGFAMPAIAAADIGTPMIAVCWSEVILLVVLFVCLTAPVLDEQSV